MWCVYHKCVNHYITDEVEDASQPSIQDFFPKAETLAAIYAEMSAVDLIPFFRLALSKQIRKGLDTRGYKPLKSHTAIANLVDQYTMEIKKEYKKFLRKKIKSGMRFSITNDEATKCNRRYAVVNAHMPGGDPLGLGQVRIKGKLDSKAAANLVREKLQEFDLDLSRDIVANTTDGCSVRCSH